MRKALRVVLIVGTILAIGLITGLLTGAVAVYGFGYRDGKTTPLIFTDVWIVLWVVGVCVTFGGWLIIGAHRAADAECAAEAAETAGAGGELP